MAKISIEDISRALTDVQVELQEKDHIIMELFRRKKEDVGFDAALAEDSHYKAAKEYTLLVALSPDDEVVGKPEDFRALDRRMEDIALQVWIRWIGIR